MDGFKRGYSRVAIYLMGESGSLTLMAVIITIKSLKEKMNSLEKLPSYLAAKSD
jgi:hypothetical protein